MIKHKRAILVLVFIIAILSVFSCILGLTLNGGGGENEFKSITGETVKIHGQGIYKNDSVSVVAQGKAQDFVTLFMAIPLLLISLYFANKNSFKGRLMLTGTIGYFLYSYISYTFLWMYNPLFLIYVLLMSASLFAFILCFNTFEVGKIPYYFNNKLPVKFLGGFQLFIGFMLSVLWLSKIAPTILNGQVPVGLEHYSTLVIQAMDLGIIVPTALLSGILIIKKKPLGYLLTSVIIFKSITMLTCITAMIINQALNKVNVAMAEVLVFSLFNAIAIIALVLLIKNVKKEVLL